MVQRHQCNGSTRQTALLLLMHLPHGWLAHPDTQRHAGTTALHPPAAAALVAGAAVTAPALIRLLAGPGHQLTEHGKHLQHTNRERSFYARPF